MDLAELNPPMAIRPILRVERIRPTENQTYGPDGNSYSTYGNTTYGSNGTTSQTYGNQTYINGPNGQSRTCSTYGNQTYCN